MKNKLFLLAVLLGSMLSFVACTEEIKPIVVDEAMLVGTWQEEGNPHEVLWRFDSTYTGETWDISEDVQEGEGTKFEWSTYKDQLRLVFNGEMGQRIPKDYIVTSQTVSRFECKDVYDTPIIFVRKI